MKNYTKWIDKHCSSLKDKNIFVLGATGSLGEETCSYLSYLNGNVYIVVRSENKGLKLIQELKNKYPSNNYYLKLLDLSSIDSVYSFVEDIKNIHIDYFISCAGVYHLERVRTKDNMEIHFATNYYNQVKLIELLKDKIKEDKGKIIVLGSISYRFGKIDFSDIEALKVKNQTVMYGKTKRLFIIHLLSLIRKGYPITIVHPGVSATGLFSPKKGKFSAFFGKLIFPLMKVIFMHPKKSALNLMYALNHEVEYSYQVGPRGLFRIWGYPIKYKFHKSVLKIDTQEKLVSIYNSLNKERN